MELEDLQRRLFTGTSVTFLGSCATSLFSMALTLVLGRILGLDDFGLYAAATSAVAFTAGMLDVRFGEAVTKFGTQFVAEENEGKAVGLIRFSYYVEIALAVLTFAVLFFPAPWIASTILKTPALAPLLRIGAFASLTGCTTATSVAVLRTFNRFKTITLVMLYVGLIRFACPVAFCLLGTADPEHAIMGLVLAPFLAMVVFTAIALQTVRTKFPGVHPESISEELKTIVPFTGQAFVSLIFKTLSRPNIGVLLVTRWGNTKDVAYVKLATSVAGMLSIVPSAVGFVTFPSFAELWAQGQRKMLLRVIGRLSALLALLLGVGGAVMLLIAPPFINIWKPHFMPSMKVMYWLVAAAAIDGICCWIRPASLSLGKPWISALVNLVRMIALIGLGIVLVKYIGYVGIGIATLVLSVSSMGLGAFLVIKSIIREKPQDEPAKENR